MKIFFYELVLLSVVVSTARSQRGSEPSAVPDPHRHPIPVHERPWHNDLAPDARFIRLEGSVAGHDTVLSPNRRWRAYIRYTQNEQGGRICLQAVQSGRQYELRGIPLPYRPISNLVWLDNHLLTFDRWSQPHHGVHYVVDVLHLRLVLSTPFPDEFIFRKQETGKDTLDQHH